MISTEKVVEQAARLRQRVEDEFSLCLIHGLLHLLAVPVNASELIFFGGFPVFVLAGCRHQDMRKLGTLGEDYRRFYEETPFLPGSRRGFLRGVSEQPIPMAIGLGVATALRHFHANLLG